MSALQFANPWVLYLLWLVPAIGAWWYYINRQREERMASFISEDMQKKLRPESFASRFTWQAALITTGLLLILVAVARPQWGMKEETVYQRGRDLVIALDVSRSMLANDVRPNRLGRAKADIMDLLKELRGDRAALLAFRRTAILLCPLTTDYAFLRQALDAVDIDSAPRGETNIGDAIVKAMDAFESDDTSHKAIILISDGEDLSGKALAAAEKAGEKHIPIFTVGLGDRRGSKIPEGDGKKDFVKYSGNDVVTKLDNDTLYAIAKKTGGAYLPVETAGMTSVNLGTLYRDHLAKLAERELEETLQRRYVERYQYFLVPALLCLLAGACLSRGRLAIGGRPKQAISPLPKTANGQTKTVEPPPLKTGLTSAGVALILLMFVSVGNAVTNAPSATTANVPEAVTNVIAPALNIPLGRDGARVAQRMYLEGKYDEAAQAYLQAARGVGEKSSRDFRYNAGVAMFKDGKFEDAADILRDVTQTDSSGKSDANMGLGAALFRAAQAERASETNAEPLIKKEKLLRQAGEAFKDAVRAEADNSVARHDMSVVLDLVPEAENQAKLAKLMADHGKTPAPQLAQKMLVEQRNLLSEMNQALTNGSPSRITQFEELAKRQNANADLWIPLKGKLLQEMSQQRSASNMQQQVAMVSQLAEATRDSMQNAAERLKDIDSSGYESAYASSAAIYQMWRAIAPYDLVLQEDLYRQGNAISNTTATVTGKAEAKTSQTEAGNLTDLFTKRFSESVPEGGEQQAAQPGGDQKAAGTNKPGITAETRAKILELAGQAKDTQDRALGFLEKDDMPGALPEEQKSYDLLKEIEKLLPKNQSQQKQEQKQDQQDQQKDQKQQKQEQQQDQKQQQAEQQKAQEEKQEPEKKDETPPDVKKMLEKALQREQEHQAELRRRNQQIPPSAIDRDW